MLRVFVNLCAALALILALGPGSLAHAGMAPGSGRTVVAEPVTGDCHQVATAATGKLAKQLGGDRHAPDCCRSALCAATGLPAAATVVIPASSAALPPPSAVAALAGREIAPPLDPPKFDA